MSTQRGSECKRQDGESWGSVREMEESIWGRWMWWGRFEPGCHSCKEALLKSSESAMSRPLLNFPPWNSTWGKQETSCGL